MKNNIDQRFRNEKEILSLQKAFFGIPHHSSSPYCFPLPSIDETCPLSPTTERQHRVALGGARGWQRCALHHGGLRREELFKRTVATRHEEVHGNRQGRATLS